MKTEPLESHKNVFSLLVDNMSDDSLGCVLLEGESGSGKSMMLNLLARHYRNDDDIITVHLGDQIDSKVHRYF